MKHDIAQNILAQSDVDRNTLWANLHIYILKICGQATVLHAKLTLWLCQTFYPSRLVQERWDVVSQEWCMLYCMGGEL